MSVIIFGNGPLPFEQNFPVTGPGARTWQILRTVAAGLTKIGSSEPVIVVGLEDETIVRNNKPGLITVHFQIQRDTFECSYIPLTYNDFLTAGTNDEFIFQSQIDVKAVIGTGSSLPYSVASRFAKRHSAPVWIDVFGDPLCETQSQQDTVNDTVSAASTQFVHVWKLLTDGLLAGDQFSALSERQRFALLGQLGSSGRLNQFTADESLVTTIPYSVFPEDLTPLPATGNQSDDFTIIWSGSFNTWMDVPTLTKGLCDALKNDPQLKLLVVGSSIPGYNDVSYDQFITGIRSAGVEGAVSLMNWQPYSMMSSLYNKCSLGISIDRCGYEAELGSRTRLINFLAGGLPVASTVVTELTENLVQAGFLMPFEVGDAESLTETLLTASRMRDVLKEKARLGRDHVLARYNGYTTGEKLSQWVASPKFAGDHTEKSLESNTNNLTLHTQQLRESLD